MAFKLNPTGKFQRQVVVVSPGKEKQSKGSFMVEFNKLPSSKRKELAEEGLDALLDAVVNKVWDLEVPEGMDPRECALDDEPCKGAMFDKYNQEMDGVERKNSKR